MRWIFWPPLDVIAAEDTRSLRRLLDIHGVPLLGRQVLAYHDHSGAGTRNNLMRHLAEGRSVAYASEAGTPLIADPGYDLVREVSEAGFDVVSAPGPSALITALTLAALPTDAFFFAGFLPNAKGARLSRLTALKEIPGTLVFYESPKRIAATLRDAVSVFGETRQAAICRELTKKFEETRRDTLANLSRGVEDHPPKGEIVLVVDRAGSEAVSETDLTSELRDALKQMSVKDAADIVSRAHNVPRRKVYQLALKLGKEQEDDA